MSNHTALEKKITKSVLSLVSKYMMKAMETIDVHEGRFMKKELKLHEVLEEPTHKTSKRKYVHTAAYWDKKRGSKRKYTKKNKKFWGSK